MHCRRCDEVERYVRQRSADNTEGNFLRYLCPSCFCLEFCLQIHVLTLVPLVTFSKGIHSLSLRKSWCLSLEFKCFVEPIKAGQAIKAEPLGRCSLVPKEIGEEIQIAGEYSGHKELSNLMLRGFFVLAGDWIVQGKFIQRHITFIHEIDLINCIVLCVVHQQNSFHDTKIYSGDLILKVLIYCVWFSSFGAVAGNPIHVGQRHGPVAVMPCAGVDHESNT